MHGVKRCVNGDKEIVYIFNNSEEEKNFTLEGEILSFGADAKMDGNVMTVPSMGVGYTIIRS